MSFPAQPLGRRSVYLLPTREGLWFGATLLVLLLAAINYGNGLAYAITFLLASLATLSSAAAQRNLLGLSVHEGLPRANFVGSPVTFRVIVVNPSALPRFGITVAPERGPGLAFDLAAHEHRTVDIPWQTRRRGPVMPPRLRLSSRYPFGLLRAFSRHIPLEDPAIAYPAPAPHAPLPSGRPSADSEQEALGVNAEGGGDFVGLSALRPGESPRHVHWKAVAAGRGLMVKRFAGLAEREIWLTLPTLGDIEERLSRLCRQVLDAEQQGYRYGLTVDGAPLTPNAGPLHLEACLSKLALYEDAIR